MSDIQSNSASLKTNRPRIAIAGGGIGGLALALALARRGYAPVVYERKPLDQIRSEGAFLTLAPNGINALRALGLAEAVIAAGLETRGLALFNEHGRRLAVVDYAAHRRQYGAPSVTVRRGALGAILLDAAIAVGVDLRSVTGIEDVELERDAVTVHASSTARYDALVACDGLRSRVRRRLFPELPEPRYSGLIGTGGVVEVDGIAPTDGLMNMTFGRRGFFGYIAEPGQPVMWFNSYPAPIDAIGQPADPQAYARYIETLHLGDPLDNARIMAAVPAIERHYPIFDMPDLARWSRGRVLLMGDAAHAVAPHSGQGASMAVEDAVVLAALFDDADGVQQAFARFFALRHDRAQAAIRVGRAAGQQKGAQGWLQLRLRDLVLPLVMPLAARAQARLFAFRADQAPLAQPVQ
ncbi:hypothetical protein XM25_20325 [Devosia sp. H5989]|nr:hypothetical protein XM25_20325 [Devosia sp. H5989]